MVGGHGEGVRRGRASLPRRASPRGPALRPDDGDRVLGRPRCSRGPRRVRWAHDMVVRAHPAGRFRLDLPGDPARSGPDPGSRAGRAEGPAAPVTGPLPRTRPGPRDTFAPEGAALVRERSPIEPEVAVVLGSGLRDAALGDVEADGEFSYEGLPGFPPTSVPGHPGRLVMGFLHGVPAAVFLGRIHLYEGHGIGSTTLISRLAAELGATSLVITNAAGGGGPSFWRGGGPFMQGGILFIR